jgi:hypothetical protein
LDEILPPDRDGEGFAVSGIAQGIYEAGCMLFSATEALSLKTKSMNANVARSRLDANRWAAT